MIAADFAGCAILAGAIEGGQNSAAGRAYLGQSGTKDRAGGFQFVGGALLMGAGRGPDFGPWLRERVAKTQM